MHNSSHPAGIRSFFPRLAILASFSLLLPLSASRADGKAEVLLPVTVTNNHGRTAELHAGIDDGATPGIDQALGEAELPPLPPVEIFDVRFTSPSSAIKLGEGSLTDIRPIANRTSTFSVTYRISFQAGRGYASVTLMLPASFPIPVRGVTMNGVHMRAGDSLVTQFGAGDITMTVDYNLAPPTITVNPTTITFAISNKDLKLPAPQGIAVTISDQNTLWHAVTDAAWLTLSAGMGTGNGTITAAPGTMSFPEGTSSGTIQFFVNPEDDPVIVTVNVDRTTAVGHEGTAADFSLAAPYPQPIMRGRGTELSFGFNLAAESSIRMRIYDQLGRAVRILIDGERHGAGAHAVAWDLRSAGGSTVAPGVYLCALECRGATLTRRFVIGE